MEAYFNTIKDYEVLPKKEERELLKKAKAGSNSAYEKIIACNLKFVVSVAKQYQNKGLPLDELIAEGNLGLVKAFHKFDLKYKNGFITYAVWWIRQCIMNALHEHSRLIRLPANKITAVTKIMHAKDHLKQELLRDPTNGELSDYISDTPSDKIFEDLKYNYSIVPLDAPQTDNQKTLHEVLPGHPSDIPDSSSDSLKEEIGYILSEFTEREQQIIEMYFGINQPRNYTLEEIGVDLGLTRERIRQIKLKVINKLKMQHRSDKLKVYLEDDIFD
ncbi:MAG: sigma-70 family RNA polymerase sigma factor [Rhodobacteraceae bacterium]|nr:sigma-70 family RNA polymerase sigma factor [Paracoccaceae bacterium]